jgi:Zn finger protein HypA/HybF involved in hydrogenase expression
LGKVEDTAIRDEIRKILPVDVKVGDLLPLSTGDRVRIEELRPDGTYGYRVIKGLTEQAKAIGTATIQNDPKLNITTGVDKLKSLQNVNQIQQEKIMANELDVTEIDRIKNAKIEKEKKREADVEAAINIAAELKGDIKQIKSELCEGPDCLRTQVQNKFGEIEKKIEHIEERTELFSCEKCGYTKVPALASFCPQCGSGIFEWTDDSGQPVSGWKHYGEK